MSKTMWNWGAYALEFAGSIMLLFVALGLISGGLTFMTSGIWNGGGSLWLPFFIGTATVASLALFFLSFSNLTSACSCDDCGCGCCGGCGCGCGHGHGNKAKIAAIVAGTTLVALTVGQAQMLVLVLLGFSLSYVGTLISVKCTCEMQEARAKPKSKR